MTTSELEHLLGEAEKKIAGGVTVTFFATLGLPEWNPRMQGYVTHGLEEKKSHFKTEPALVRILTQLARRS